MMKKLMLCAIAISIICSGCSDKKAQKEQDQINTAMAKHCARIKKLSLEEYTKQYFLHNDTTDKDRLAAKKDWEHCQKFTAET